MARKFIRLQPGYLDHEGATEVVNFPEQEQHSAWPNDKGFAQPTQSAKAHPFPIPAEEAENVHPDLPHRQRIKIRIQKQKPVELWLTGSPETEPGEEK